MPLQPQNIPFSFSAGLNSKIDDYQLINNQLLQADNVSFTKDGSISKRPGFEALSNTLVNGGDITSGLACQVFNDELLLFDGNFVYSYLPSSDEWINRGTATSIINTQNKILSTRTASQSNIDGTSLNGLECYVWMDNTIGIKYSIIDSVSGAFIVSDQFLYKNSGFDPKVIASPKDNAFHIYYKVASNIIYKHIIYTTLPTILQPQILVSNGGYNPICYDAFVFDGYAAIAYTSDVGITFSHYNPGWLNYSISFGVITTPITVISACQTTSGAYYIAYACSSGTYVYSSHTEATILIDTNIAINITIIEDYNLEDCNITYEISNNSSYGSRINNLIVQSTDKILNNSSFKIGVGLASKAFKYNNQIFVNTIYYSLYQSTYFTFNVANMNCVNKINPSVSGVYRDNGLLAQCDNISNNIFLFANQKKSAIISQNNTLFSTLGVNASYIDFTNTNSFNSREGANNLHIVGGIEKIYDGVSIVEDNFHLYPETPDGYGCDYITTSEGTYLQAGQYQYIICYEWTDNFSQIQRGQPSIANTVNLVSSQTTGFGVILQVPTLKITDKNNVSIAIFRTAILAGGLPSSIFYKITSDANPLINDPTVDYLTFYDTTFETSDSQIQSNETLYTSQQLFNSAPPSCNLISNYQTRLMLSGMEDPNIIWTSQDRFELDNYNTIPIEFSPLLIEGVDPVGGAITAIHVLDGNLIIFKEDTIFIMSGDGPNANATNGSFSNATKIPSDAGCINQNSIIEIPGNQFNSGGLMYQSSKGIYLFDRGQINSYIGQQVEQYNNLTITSAELLNDTNEVIFISKEGIILCYNYLFNRWSTWSWIPAVDSCIWNDKLVLLQSNGTILVQTPTLYSDNGKLISRTVQLPWLAFAGLQGYQSVMSATLLGHYLSPHVLRISTCYNYNPTPTEPIDISSTVISNLFGMQSFFGEAPNFGGGNFTPYQFQVNFAYPYCQSISLIIKDVPLDNIDQGSILSNINFRVGIFNDPVRLPAKNKFGGKKR